MEELQPQEPQARYEPQGPQEPVSDNFTLHVLSDSLGQTAVTFSRVMASRFPSLHFTVVRTPMVSDPLELAEVVRPHCKQHNYLFVYTFAQQDLLDKMKELCDEGCYAVDLLGQALRSIRKLSGVRPTGKVGAIHTTDEAYYQRIEAMEYTINHDDGRHPEGLLEADIVLIGVSRSGKTPLSTFLAYRGWKVANLPLAAGLYPPEQIFEVDARRLYGLVTTPEVLTRVREARSVEFGTFLENYSSREHIEHELESARELMRQLGCIVINTANRAIEEVAQEILWYALMVDPQHDL